MFIAGNATRSAAPEWVDGSAEVGDDGLARGAETGAGTVFLRAPGTSTARGKSAPRLSRGASESPALSAAAGRDPRPPRDRVAGPALPEPGETEESTPTAESDASTPTEESPGPAHATPEPPVATPMPKATANPPTRPTYADARTRYLPRTTDKQTNPIADKFRRPRLPPRKRNPKLRPDRNTKHCRQTPQLSLLLHSEVGLS